MDQKISAVIGAIIFTAFVAGLAESIGALPFIFIVAFVILLMGIDTVQTIREQARSRKSNEPSK